MSNWDFQKKLNEAYELMQNDTELSLKLFDELLDVDCENIEVLNGKGSALMKSNRNDEAEQYFNKSIEIQENPSAWINKGLIAKNNNEYHKALICYERAIHLNPALNNIVTILKREVIELIDDNILNITNYSPEAIKYIRKGMDFKTEKKLWDALECFTNAIKEDPSCKNPITIFIENIKGILYNEFLFETPNFEDTEIDKLEVESLKALLIEENPRKALDLMDEILNIDENELDALNYKGCILFLFDEYSQSIDYFNKCLKCDEKYYSALFNKAIVLRMMNKLKDALECFNILLNEGMYENKVKLYKLEILEKLNDN